MHAHFVTDSYVEQASAAGHDRPDGMAGMAGLVPEAHRDLMEGHGITAAVLSMSSPGVHFGDDAAARRLAREVNEHAAALAQDHRAVRSFAALPLPDSTAHSKRSRTPSTIWARDGVALMTNAGGVYLGESASNPSSRN